MLSGNCDLVVVGSLANGAVSLDVTDDDGVRNCCHCSLVTGTELRCGLCTAWESVLDWGGETRASVCSAGLQQQAGHC